MLTLKTTSLPKTMIATVVALIVSTSALAHDPKLHSQDNKMNCESMQKNIAIMEKMDHSHMDMSSPAMQSMMMKMTKMKQMYQEHCTANDDDS